jgi:hypothetical protein
MVIREGTMKAQNYMAFRCELERYRKAAVKTPDKQLMIGLLISEAVTAYREKDYERADGCRIKAKALTQS